MKIILFNHQCILNRYDLVAKEQVELFEYTKLIDRVDEFNLMMHYNEEDFKFIKDRWKDKKNVVYHFFDKSFQPWYEATTIHYIQELVHSTDEEFYVVYTHSKGCSKPNSDHDRNWLRYLHYFMVENWKYCLKKLDEGYEIVSAAWLERGEYSPYFPGNFWWARASYLRRCKRLKTPPENNFIPQFRPDVHHRFDLEYWHGSGRPKLFDLQPHGRYQRWLDPPETYRDTIFIY